MSRKNSSKSPNQRIRKLSKPNLAHRSEYRYSSSATAREALYRAIHEIDTKNKKRSKQVEKLRYLIYELQSLQPTDVLTLSTSLGQCENTTRSQLKKLEKLDLVISTRFEFHNLYCVNGDFNKFIEDILEHFFSGK
jgi:predicted transcriptional regulator